MIERWLGNPHKLADFNNRVLPFTIKLDGKLTFCAVDCLRSTAAMTAGTGGQQTGLSAFPNQIALKFCKCAEQMEDESPL